jgi:hypothetical protein
MSPEIKNSDFGFYEYFNVAFIKITRGSSAQA